jgi:hypothetical protein
MAMQVGVITLVLVSIGWAVAQAAAGTTLPDAHNVVSVGRLDIEGGGMVDVRGNLAVIGHMGPPYATSILDVSDPAAPKLLARIPVKPGTHSHKARLCGTTLITNHEAYGGGPQSSLGLGFFDVSDPARPREIGFFPAGGGNGVHRFEADCARKLVYAGMSADGYRGSLVRIVSFADPSRPVEVGRWALPGQRVGGGEAPLKGFDGYRVHHPNRLGDRLYVSLWSDGFAIVDIADLARPKTVSLTNYPRPSGAPTHTALPVGHAIGGRRWAVLFDEDLGGGCERPAHMWMADITDERTPVVGAPFQPPAPPRCEGRSGAHQPHEFVGEDNLVYAAWFNRGLRVVDIGDPYRPTEVGHYVPRREGGRPALTNDVFVDGRGLIYLIDRDAGLDILRFTGRSQNPP